MMKKITLTLVAIFATCIFAGSALATGDIICMGNSCNPTPGTNPHHPPVTWNNPDMSYKTNQSFHGDFNGGSNTYGYGNGPKSGQSYAMGEQSFNHSADINMTNFRSGTACGGNCDDNKAELGFSGNQSFHTGAMQESNGGRYSGAFAGSSAHGNFGANGSLNFD